MTLPLRHVGEPGLSRHRCGLKIIVQGSTQEEAIGRRVVAS